MMSIANRLSAAVMLAGALICMPGLASAGLTTEFAGFDTVWEVGTSGLKSSYYSDTRSGNLLPSYMPTLTGRVAYPHGIGEVPSPGAYDPVIARRFDEGVLGVKVDGDSLVVKVAGGVDAQAGFYYSGWNTWYGQGDVFLTVKDMLSGLRQFALLNAWPREGGNPRTLDGARFDAAKAFHIGGGTGGTSMEGRLVTLSNSSQVVAVGGTGSYSPTYSPPPEGLDYRVFAQGGTDVGDAGLVHGSTQDSGYGGVNQTWYVQTWTVPLDLLSSDVTFDIALHKAASCGNDQIGGLFTIDNPPSVQPEPIPVPASVILGALGLLVSAVAIRRIRQSEGPSELNSAKSSR